MKDRKNYVISELAKALEVPRTTINDWLARYAQYIEFEVRGKRKVYFETSLQVLKEIAQMRDSGKSSFEIEAELTKIHPVQAEVAGTKTEIENTSEGESTDLMPPVVRKQAEEIGRMLGEELKNISSKLEASKSMNDRLAKKNMRWYLLALSLLVLLGATAIVTSNQIIDMMQLQQIKLNASQQTITGHISQANTVMVDELRKRDSVICEQQKNLVDELRKREQQIDEQQKKMTDDQQKRETQLAEQHSKLLAEQKKRELKFDEHQRKLLDELHNREQMVKSQHNKLQEFTVALDRSSKDYQKNIDQLKSELIEQRKSFTEMLEKTSSELKQQKESELNLLKDNFARERLEMLKKLEDASKELAAKSEMIEKMGAKTSEQSETIKDWIRKNSARQEITVPTRPITLDPKL
ncbi:MAG: MerR family transcriptional regulator [Victivallaceae bacterium]